MAEANLGHPVLEKNFTTTKNGDKLIKNVLKSIKEYNLHIGGNDEDKISYFR